MGEGALRERIVVDTVLLLSMVVRYYGSEKRSRCNSLSKHQRPVLAARLDHAHRPPCRRPLTITRIHALLTPLRRLLHMQRTRTRLHHPMPAARRCGRRRTHRQATTPSTAWDAELVRRSRAVRRVRVRSRMRAPQHARGRGRRAMSHVAILNGWLMVLYYHHLLRTPRDLH